jgi:hypothetical protein
MPEIGARLRAVSHVALLAVSLFTSPTPLMRINNPVLQPDEMKRDCRRTVMSNVAVLDSTVQETHEWLKDITDG